MESVGVRPLEGDVEGPPPLSIGESEARDILLACAESPVFFSRFCRTPLGPFPQFPFVHRRIDMAYGGRDVLRPKSRQMMASWIACFTRLHKVMFRPEYSGIVTSRKEALVDDGGENSTFDSLLGRVRYLYGSLPDFLQAAAPLTFSHLRVSCPQIGSHIKGESTNPNVGRGGTYDDGLGDEWAFVPQSAQAYRSLRSAVHKQLELQSTPNGPSNNFAELWDRTPPSFIRDRLHWTEHPLRYSGGLTEGGKPTSPWYEAECAKIATADGIARELDIDFSASVSGLVYPEFSYDRHMRNDIFYDPDLQLHMGMDFGIGAATAALFFQLHGREVWVLRDYELENAAAVANAENVASTIGKIGFRGERSELACHGDPAGNAREIATGSTVIREYRQAGFTNFSTPRAKVLDGIRLVRRLLAQGRLYFSVDCALVPKRVADYRFPTDDIGGVKGDTPVKNRATHLMDALRYGVTGVFPTDDALTEMRATPLGEPVPPPSEWRRDKPEIRERSWNRTVVGPRKIY